MAIQFLRGTKSKITASNKVLADGQPLYEKDTHKLKVGDGSTAAKSLPYIKVDTDSSLSSTSTNPIENKAVNTALSGKANSSHTHNASDITSGVIPLNRGGTGSSVDLDTAPNGAIIRKLKDADSNELGYTPTKNGALYATSENGVPSFGTLPIAQGGTGAASAAKARENIGAAASSHTHGAGDITGTLGIAHGGTGATSASAARTNLGFTHGTAEPTGTPSTGNGAVYFMEDDGTPLSIAEGGTGASTAANARANLQLKFLNVTPTFSTTNNVDANNSGGNLAVLPGLRLAIFRCGVVTKKQFSAGYTYNIASVPDEYVPTSSFGLGAYSTDGTLCARFYATDKVVQVNIKDTVASGSSIYISGIWYY